MWTPRPRLASRRLEVERLEDRLVLSADAIRSGFDAFTLARNDDASTGSVALGFDINFFGVTRNSLFVNNNGNVTFDSSLSTFTPFNLTTTNRQIIAPFFADVDTRGASSTGDNIVRYGQGTVDGHRAFGVIWDEVGYFSTRTDKLNSFQLLIIQREDIGPGAFDIELNYNFIQWEAGQASGGVNGLGGSSARIGFANGSQFSFEFEGSGVNGAFLDTPGMMDLSEISRNSNVAGRHVFYVRNGVIATNQPPILDNLPATIQLNEGDPFAFTVQAHDPEHDPLRYSLVNPPAGFLINEFTGVISFTQPSEGPIATPTSNGPASYNLTVRVADNRGNFAQAVLHIDVGNVAPSVTAGDDVNLAAAMTLERVVSFTDPGDDSWTATVDYGDGTTEEFTTFTLSDGVRSFTISHNYSGTSQQFTVNVRINDGTDTGTDSFDVQVNHAPVFNPIETLSVYEGQTYQFNVNASDSDDGDQLTYSLVSPVTGVSLDSETGLVTFAATNNLPNGGVDVTVLVKDNGNPQLSAQKTFHITVENVSPSFEAGADALLTRGDTLQRDITFTDPGEDAWTVTIDYGDGTEVVPFAVTTRIFSLDHTYNEDGIHHVIVAVFDGTVTTIDTFDIGVALAAEQILDSTTDTVAQGETSTLSVSDEESGVSGKLSIERDPNAGDSASVFFALYGNSNPTSLPRAGDFFEINIQNGSVNDKLVLQYTPTFTAAAYDIGYFDETQNPPVWISLNAEVSINENGVLTIVFPPGTNFNFTVFAVSVANTVTQTGTVTPPTVQANTTSTSDVQASISLQVSFTSRTSQTLTVSSSQDSSLGPVGLSQGTASSSRSSLTSGSGSGKKTEKQDQWWSVFGAEENPEGEGEGNSDGKVKVRFADGEDKSKEVPKQEEEEMEEETSALDAYFAMYRR